MSKQIPELSAAQDGLTQYVKCKHCGSSNVLFLSQTSWDPVEQRYKVDFHTKARCKRCDCREVRWITKR